MLKNVLEKALTVIEGDAEKDLTQFPDSSFDFVILSQTLQAFLNPETVISELLKSGEKSHSYCAKFWILESSASSINKRNNANYKKSS